MEVALALGDELPGFIAALVPQYPAPCDMVVSQCAIVIPPSTDWESACSLKRR